jgi:Helix-turn-helix domain
VSRATLARRFAHLVGETPPEYLTRWRMDLAAQRLRDTDDTVATIADAVGYRSEYSFSRAFARHRGLAPGRYRRHTRSPRLGSPARRPAHSCFRASAGISPPRLTDALSAERRDDAPSHSGRFAAMDA